MWPSLRHPESGVLVHLTLPLSLSLILASVGLFHQVFPGLSLDGLLSWSTKSGEGKSAFLQLYFRTAWESPCWPILCKPIPKPHCCGLIIIFRLAHIIEYIWCGRLCVQHFPCIISHNLCNSSLYRCYYCPHFIEEDWVRKVKKLCKVTHQPGEHARIPIQMVRLQSLSQPQACLYSLPGWDYCSSKPEDVSGFHSSVFLLKKKCGKIHLV